MKTAQQALLVERNCNLKPPSFQFYPGDWLKDPALRSVCYAARGLWIDMLSLMHENDRRGFLQVNGKLVTAEQLARMTGGSTDEVSRHLLELESAGVYSCTADGVIYNRRMVRDELVRQQTKERVKRHRNKTVVTLMKRPGTEGEDEEEVRTSKKMENGQSSFCRETPCGIAAIALPGSALDVRKN